MKEYLGYDTIPVYNFYKISESNDFRWFYKKYDGHNIEELKDDALLLLAERFKQIFLDRIEYKIFCYDWLGHWWLGAN